MNAPRSHFHVSPIREIGYLPSGERPGRAIGGSSEAFGVSYFSGIPHTKRDFIAKLCALLRRPILANDAGLFDHDEGHSRAVDEDFAPVLEVDRDALAND